MTDTIVLVIVGGFMVGYLLVCGLAVLPPQVLLARWWRLRDDRAKARRARSRAEPKHVPMENGPERRSVAPFRRNRVRTPFSLS